MEKQLVYVGRTSPLFTGEVLRCICDYSSEVPRLIHRHWALLSRMATVIVDDHIVKIVLTTELNTVA